VRRKKKQTKGKNEERKRKNRCPEPRSKDSTPWNFPEMATFNALDCLDREEGAKGGRQEMRHGSPLPTSFSSYPPTVEE
jgi:hypothetical protein